MYCLLKVCRIHSAGTPYHQQIIPDKRRHSEASGQTSNQAANNSVSYVARFGEAPDRICQNETDDRAGCAYRMDVREQTAGEASQEPVAKTLTTFKPKPQY